MLFWLRIIFCSIQILDRNLLLDLNNTSGFLKTLENIGLCENEGLQQKNTELTTTEDKKFYENRSNSNILDDLTDFIDESFNNGYDYLDII